MLEPGRLLNSSWLAIHFSFFIFMHCNLLCYSCVIPYNLLCYSCVILYNLLCYSCVILDNLLRYSCVILYNLLSYSCVILYNLLYFSYFMPWNVLCYSYFVLCQLYHDSQLYWRRKPEYSQKTTNLPQVTNKLDHIKLYQIHLA